jgi:transglycosylase-like protein
VRKPIMAVAAAVLLVPAAAEARAVYPAAPVVERMCSQTFTIRDYRRYVGAVYRRDRVSLRARRRLVAMRDCARNNSAERWMARWRERRARERAARIEAARQRAIQRQWASAGAPPESIAQCESGGDPTAVSPDGRYRGKWQFDQQTWESVGGTGDPAQATEAEQDYRAGILYRQRGAQPWPVCGR